MSRFIYNGKNIYYTELGDGRPLLLLHGNTASSNMFGGVEEQFAANHRVVLLDFLGHGRSDRLERFPADLWYDEAMQVIALMRERQYESVDIIGSSGGALVAVNAALEAPALVGKIIADSFEGERALPAFTENMKEERERSKHDPGAVMFYKAMQGADWESVVDNDTDAVIRHSRELGIFFHKPLCAMQADVLLTGSLEDEFVTALEQDFFRKTYGELLSKIGHGSMHLFEHGGHPAMLSNQAEFVRLSEEFLSTGI
ncbi:MAG TPA: alpha/beta hydrolase [Clostridia bacterium]|nr:alpha/beta hydrolase [Clostridia bacterium]